MKVTVKKEKAVKFIQNSITKLELEIEEKQKIYDKTLGEMEHSRGMIVDGLSAITYGITYNDFLEHFVQDFKNYQRSLGILRGFASKFLFHDTSRSMEMYSFREEHLRTYSNYDYVSYPEEVAENRVGALERLLLDIRNCEHYLLVNYVDKILEIIQFKEYDVSSIKSLCSDFQDNGFENNELKKKITCLKNKVNDMKNIINTIDVLGIDDETFELTIMDDGNVFIQSCKF